MGALTVISPASLKGKCDWDTLALLKRLSQLHQHYVHAARLQTDFFAWWNLERSSRAHLHDPAFVGHLVHFGVRRGWGADLDQLLCRSPVLRNVT